MNYTSSCQCGEVTLLLELANPIESYEPRLCDCDFCKSREITYLSDANSMLTIKPFSTLKQSKQGSEQATFWHCSSCDKIVAVTIDNNGTLKGAVNAQLFSGKYELQEAVVVSPKLLSPMEKSKRWNSLWLEVKYNE